MLVLLLTGTHVRCVDMSLRAFLFVTAALLVTSGMLHQQAFLRHRKSRADKENVRKVAQILLAAGTATRQLSTSNAMSLQAPKSIATDIFVRQHAEWQRASFTVLTNTMNSNKPTEEISPVVTTLLKVLDGSYPEQLVALMQQSAASPGDMDTFVAVLEEMITQSSCEHMLPVIHELYPHTSLSSHIYVPNGTNLLQTIAARFPKLAQCALAGP